MKVTHSDAPVASTSLMPACLRPYLKAIENIGTVCENITQTAVILSEAGVNAADLSNKMIQLRLAEVANSLSTRPALT